MFKHYPITGMICMSILFVGIIALFILLTKLIWNAVIPDVTNGALSPISFWQTVGLILLSRIFFGTINFKKD